jgi:hypothetical protein
LAMSLFNRSFNPQDLVQRAIANDFLQVTFLIQVLALDLGTKEQCACT